MRKSHWVWTAPMVLALVFYGCAGSAQKALSKSQTILALSPAKGYVKKVAMVQAPVPTVAFDRHAADFFYKKLAATIRKEKAEVQLLVSEEDKGAGFLAGLAHAARPINAAALSQEGRHGGYQGLITAALHSVYAEAYKSGLLWFRKTRYRYKFEVTLDLYDPITGAKLLSLLEERSAEINEAVYNEHIDGTISTSENLDKALIRLAEDIGDQVVETLKGQPWLVSVIEAEGERIQLASGRQAGLRTGQRLAVVEGQRQLKGTQSESFVLPGLKIGEVVITSVSDKRSEAKTDSPGKIAVGDIAIPIR